MPLSRAKSSRSKSRSPAPPPSFQSSPRPFLPPSHYAAANGIPYPPTGKSQKNEESSQKSRFSQFESVDGYSPSDYLFEYATQSTHSSGGTLEFKNRLDETGSHQSDRPSKQAARKSSLGNLPMMEAHILPSLRDTIDKMTRPPSRILVESKQEQIQPPAIRSSSVSSSNTSSSASAFPMSPSPMPSSLRAPSSSKFSSSPRPPIATPSPHLEAPTTAEQPVPKFKASSDLKSVLKPALRTPTAKATPTLTEYSSDTKESRILRPARSIIGNSLRGSEEHNLASEKVRSPFADIKPGATSTPIRQGRARSFTNPETSFVPKKPKAIPMTPQPENITHIPALQALKRRNKERLDDDSDLEARYANEERSRRRLVVANAAIVPSSSEGENSDHGSVSRSRLPIPSGRWDQPSVTMKQNPNLAGGSFGLGLGLPDSIGRRDRKGGPETQKVVTEENGSSFGRQGAFKRELASTPDMRDESASRRNTEQSRQHRFIGEEETKQKRQNALMGLVDELNAQKENSHARMDSDSSYYGQKGLAISGSTEVNLRQNEIDSDCESEYPSEDEQQREIISPRMTSHHWPPGRPSSRSAVQAQLPARPEANRRTSGSVQDGQKPGRESNNGWFHDTLAETSQQVAARERQALGIPPSTSDEMYHYGQIKHVDSDLSSVVDRDDAPWQEECTLSAGAETLFRRLNGAQDYEKDNTDGEVELTRESDRGFANLSRPLEGGFLSSTNEQAQNENQGMTAWRSTFSPSKYISLQTRYGEMEMQRQEILFELFESEERFVSCLHILVSLFITPLRVRDRRAWIAGVPSEMTRLFDWLEDIVNVHSHILSVLESSRNLQQPVVIHAAEGIRGSVARFEVYQPYVVRLAEATKLLEGGGESEFREFVRIQEGTQECAGWTLAMLLVEPMNRLSKYPEYFRRLREATPKSHPDYLLTFALTCSINMMIRTITEVKLLEDEYEQVRETSKHILNLPPSFFLAKRERRLLAKGVIRQIAVPAAGNSDSDSLAPTHESTMRNSKLYDAINGWDGRRKRSTSGASTATGTSFRSYHTPELLTPMQGNLSRAKGQYKPNDESASAQKSARRGNGQIDPLYGFVFTDVMLLTTSLRDGKAWNLVDGIGITRVLGFEETMSDSSETLVELDLLPLFTSSQPNVATIALQLQDEIPKWRSALHQCHQTTLHALSQTSSSQSGSMIDPETDIEQNLKSLLSAGLPMPKSPSMHLDEASQGQAGSARQQEREERGWWSVRFQQVFRDLQKQDIPICM